MKKVLIFLLVLGVLIIGTAAAVEELAEDSYERYTNFSDNSSGNDFGDITPCDEGGGNGGGGIPG